MGNSSMRRTRMRSGPAGRIVRIALTATALLFLFGFVVLPLVAVFAQALSRGVQAWGAAVTDPAALAAVRLTLLTCALAVPLNCIFGIAAAWAVTRFEFRGKNLLVSVIDLPFAISPVVVGMMLISLYGLHGLVGPAMEARGLRVIFALPGVVLATVFVTMPFVARELIPLMEACGHEEEECARLLGAGGWQIFRRVTLPSIKWALLYGVILANARAMGEFGAVSVVSGHIRGVTNTVPLHVEVLYDEFNFQAAFSVASILALLAVGTLAAKSFVSWYSRQRGGNPEDGEIA
ncbi:MAG: sulfate ABC transporter permease subunit CysW [Deltaproteobacteria bacterium]|nr:sulfate ABC transporter permease subunit CysW [Deltaproteobacteria bacterium]